jgi:hypothetical protein
MSAVSKKDLEKVKQLLKPEFRGHGGIAAILRNAISKK